MAHTTLSCDAPLGRGAFIVFEGGDRAGKSTQAGILAAALNTTAIGFPNRSTRIGALIGAHLTNAITLPQRAIHLLFSANRWECADSIKSILSRGEHVICDRYIYSGIAHAIANGMRDGAAQSPDLGLPEPDVVIYLSIDSTTASQRAGYGEERHDIVSFQTNVGRAFSRMSRQPNWYTFNAADPKDDIAAGVLATAHDAITQCTARPIRTFTGCL